MTGDKINKENLAFSDISDFEMASMVRMLTRTDLLHEAVCVGARDRIMYLSQQLENRDASIEKLNTEIKMLKDEKLDLTFQVSNLEEEKVDLENKIYNLEGELERISYGDEF